MENLVNRIKDIHQLSKDPEYAKSKGNYEALSTAMSECCSINYQTERDVEELEDKIIRMRMVKIENNEDVETMEEELFELEKIVKARTEYNDHLKLRIDTRMLAIQKTEDELPRGKAKSVLNKSLDTVADMFKLSKWWA